jgi:hypothetical protein
VLAYVLVEARGGGLQHLNCFEVLVTVWLHVYSGYVCMCAGSYRIKRQAPPAPFGENFSVLYVAACALLIQHRTAQHPTSAFHLALLLLNVSGSCAGLQAWSVHVMLRRACEAVHISSVFLCSTAQQLMCEQYLSGFGFDYSCCVLLDCSVTCMYNTWSCVKNLMAQTPA